MTLQQWLFSIKGRIGRRDFWIWMGLWLLAMLVLFTAAARDWLTLQTAAFALVCLLWPTAAVTVKRLHDRGRSGLWALLLILAWMLLAGNWTMLSGLWAWALGRVVPTVMLILLLVELGAITGTRGENQYGKVTLAVKYR